MTPLTDLLARARESQKHAFKGTAPYEYECANCGEKTVAGLEPECYSKPCRSRLNALRDAVIVAAELNASAQHGHGYAIHLLTTLEALDEALSALRSHLEETRE